MNLGIPRVMNVMLHALLMTTDLAIVFHRDALYTHGLSAHPQASPASLGSGTIALGTGANLGKKPAVEEFYT